MPFEGSPFRQAARIIEYIVQKMGVLPIDVLVRTAEQIKAREEMGDRFIRDILERGKVLYEANHAGMGQQS